MSQLTRKAIMKCTLELAEKKSLKKITVKDIADECGITRSTFYYHFSDIYDVLDGVVQAKIDEFNEEYNGESIGKYGLIFLMQEEESGWKNMLRHEFIIWHFCRLEKCLKDTYYLLRMLRLYAAFMKKLYLDCL